MHHRIIPTFFPKRETALSERQQRMYDFLTDTPVGVLATVDPNGCPHGAVIYFTVDKQFNLFFLTKTGTKKYDNLIRNDQVMLIVHEPVSQSVAQVIGKTFEIKDSYEVNRVAQRIFEISLRTSEAGVPPINKLHAGAYTAFLITPLQIRMAVYERPDDGDYGHIFESIESFELPVEF